MIGRLDFSEFLGGEPTWVPCIGCDTLTTRSPCWSCSRIAEAKADAARERASALATIPPHFRWAQLGAPELVKRVSSPESVGSIAARILGAHRVVLVGPSGCGKTSLACACLRERVPDARFVDALELGTARIQHSAGDGEAALVERAIATPLLLLDEVGQAEPTKTDAVKDVVFRRFAADRPTWVTTGLRGDALTRMYGAGFIRRLGIGEGALVVKLGVV